MFKRSSVHGIDKVIEKGVKKIDIISNGETIIAVDCLVESYSVFTYYKVDYVA